MLFRSIIYLPGPFDESVPCDESDVSRLHSLNALAILQNVTVRTKKLLLSLGLTGNGKKR